MKNCRHAIGIMSSLGVIISGATMDSVSWVITGTVILAANIIVCFLP